MQTATITWSWKPISRCPRCGSPDLELDHELEFYECRDCGSSGGGASYWELEKDATLPDLRVCWGCGDPLLQGEYCESCQVSLRLIRKLQEDGTPILWTIPEMRLR